jgi:hypothetical protein
MEELKFASKEEAIQYLSDTTGKKVVVAGRMTNLKKKVVEHLPFKPDVKPFKVSKLAFKSALEDLFEMIADKEYGAKINSAIKGDSDAKGSFKQLKEVASGSAIVEAEDKFKLDEFENFLSQMHRLFFEGGLDEDADHIQKIRGLIEKAENEFKDFSKKFEAENEQRKKMKMSLSIAKKSKKKEAIERALSSLKAQMGMMLGAVKEILSTPQFTNAARFASENKPEKRTVVAFDSEEEAIQYLSNVTNAKVFISCDDCGCDEDCDDDEE